MTTAYINGGAMNPSSRSVVLRVAILRPTGYPEAAERHQ